MASNFSKTRLPDFLFANMLTCFDVHHPDPKSAADDRRLTSFCLETASLRAHWEQVSVTRSGALRTYPLFGRTIARTATRWSWLLQVNVSLLPSTRGTGGYSNRINHQSIINQQSTIKYICIHHSNGVWASSLKAAWCCEGDTTVDLIWRLLNGAMPVTSKVKQVVLQVGSNNLLRQWFQVGACLVHNAVCSECSVFKIQIVHNALCSESTVFSFWGKFRMQRIHNAMCKVFRMQSNQHAVCAECRLCDMHCVQNVLCSECSVFRMLCV